MVDRFRLRFLNKIIVGLMGFVCMALFSRIKPVEMAEALPATLGAHIKNGSYRYATEIAIFF